MHNAIPHLLYHLQDDRSLAVPQRFFEACPPLYRNILQDIHTREVVGASIGICVESVAANPVTFDYELWCSFTFIFADGTVALQVSNPPGPLPLSVSYRILTQCRRLLHLLSSPVRIIHGRKLDTSENTGSSSCDQDSKSQLKSRSERDAVDRLFDYNHFFSEVSVLLSWISARDKMCTQYRP